MEAGTSGAYHGAGPGLRGWFQLDPLDEKPGWFFGGWCGRGGWDRRGFPERDGDFIERGFSRKDAANMDKALADHIDEIVWTDNLHQGYVRVVLERERGRADFIAVSTVLSQDYSTCIINRAPFAHKGGTVDFT